MAAGGHVAAHQAGVNYTGVPSGMGGDYNGEILLLLISSAGLIFIDNARSGKGQSGDQYLALGIMGFVLLFLGQFAPELAFAFTLLVFVAIILNSPNGIPFVPGTSSDTADSTNAGTATNDTGIDLSPPKP